MARQTLRPKANGTTCYRGIRITHWTNDDPVNEVDLEGVNWSSSLAAARDTGVVVNDKTLEEFELSAKQFRAVEEIHDAYVDAGLF